MAPNMLPWSVIATAGIPNAFAFFINSLMRTAPSSKRILRVQMEMDEGVGGGGKSV